MNTLIFLIILFYVVPFLLKKAIEQQRTRAAGADTIRVTQNPLKDIFKSMPFTTSSMKDSFSTARIKGRKTKWVFFAIAGIALLIKSIVVIPAGMTGVVDVFGKVRDKEISSGLHLVNPLAKVIKMTIRTEEYTMSVTRGEGQRKGADAIRALTNEGLTVDLDITAFYHLKEDQAASVYRELSTNYVEKIIRPEIRSAIREIIAQYDAKAVYSDKREEIAQAIKDRLVATVGPRGIVVEQILLRNVTLPENLAKSIQEKLQAEQESQQYDFLLERETKEADRKRIEAEGQRDAQKIINESLSPRYLQYLYINELKEREGTIYVPTSPTNGLPAFRGI